MTHAPPWAQALQDSALGELIRSSLFLYPAANVLHLLAVVLLVGPIVALDLRLLGLARGLPAALLDRYLTRFPRVMLPLLLITGFALFVADAGHLAANAVFWIKLALAGAALANALLFRRLWQARLATWDDGAPAAGRLQAALSLTLWLGAAASGRLIAYF